jgi:bis(5'-nucleosyl)-tetraphosphatase (symmetrical)
MEVYAVGDVQGHQQTLRSLLDQAGFDPGHDRLWLVGDLVNRGPQSLEVLRFVRSLGPAATLVLGNHEIHLLAVAEGVRRLRNADTLSPVLDAPDCAELMDWLRRQPLLHVDPNLGYCMVHAGIPPQWDLAAAAELAREAQDWLRVSGFAEVTAALEAEPVELSPDLSPAHRVRVIVSYFTRMRVCTPAGRLDLAFKGSPEHAPSGYSPWFAHPGRKTRDERVIFGHWAALNGQTDTPNVFALDTGCAWGRSLTLMRLSDGHQFSCACPRT